MTLSARPNIVRDDLPPQNARNTPRSKGRPSPWGSQYFRNRRFQDTQDARPHVANVQKSPKPDMPPPFTLEILPDVGDQTGVDSVHETVGEVIRTVVSMDLPTAPLDVTPVPLQRKPRPELLFQPPGLAPVVLRKDEPGTTNPPRKPVRISLVGGRTRPLWSQS